MKLKINRLMQKRFGHSGVLAMLCLSCGLLFAACGPVDAHNNDAENAIPKPDSIVTITIRAVGDLMCHAPQFEYARLGTDTFDFRRCYAEVADYLKGADFTIGNIETVFAGPTAKYTGYPTFNSPEDYLDAVKEAGFDFLVTANNHSLDRGGNGAFKTLDVLDKYGFDHTGTYRSPADRDSIRVVNVKGISMAILNYTYGTNGIPIPKDKPWIINLTDTLLIEKDVLAARALKPDLVVVSFHWGLEYQHEPCDSQRIQFEAAAAAGADLILGSHPHVIQPVEYYKTAANASLDTGFVAWSMGISSPTKTNVIAMPA
ncbi:MAG: CapA family protein [Bacteroidetes bacterium]|nr:CapA family protein [Bacteroidota bacterium]